MTVNEAAARLREKDDILIVTHIRPDGDTVGSGSALCNALRKMGKRAFLYPNPQFEDCYPWISQPYVAPAGFEYNFVVAVDTADVKMLPKGFEGPVDLCIDHHPSNTFYAAETCLDPKKASCGEIVLEIIKAARVDLGPDLADQLYVAVSTDCGCFTYGNTTSDTHRAAAELGDAGASIPALNKILFRTASRARIALEGMIYGSLRYFHGGRTVFAVVTKEMLEKSGAEEKDCVDLASLPGRVEGAATSATLKEMDGGWKASLRTNGEVNVSRICALFGGGGHAMAAGCCLELPLDRALEALAGAIEEARGK